MMVGLGETWDEILRTMGDLRSVDCDLLTIGQYLRPSQKHVALARWYTPEEFAELKREAGGTGLPARRLGTAGPEFVPRRRAARHGDRRRGLNARPTKARLVSPCVRPSIRAAEAATLLGVNGSRWVDYRARLSCVPRDPRGGAAVTG